MPQLAEKLKISRKTVAMRLKSLKEKSVIERVGSDRKGYWKKESYVLERTVDVHITRLRKKLGTFGERLTNRSGYGYCIEF